MLSDAEENAKRFGSQVTLKLKIKWNLFDFFEIIKVGLLRAATMTLKDAEKKNLTKRAPANLTTGFYYVCGEKQNLILFF